MLHYNQSSAILANLDEPFYICIGLFVHLFLELYHRKPRMKNKTKAKSY